MFERNIQSYFCIEEFCQNNKEKGSSKINEIACNTGVCNQFLHSLLIIMLKMRPSVSEAGHTNLIMLCVGLVHWCAVCLYSSCFVLVFEKKLNICTVFLPLDMHFTQLLVIWL